MHMCMYIYICMYIYMYMSMINVYCMYIYSIHLHGQSCNFFSASLCACCACCRSSCCKTASPLPKKSRDEKPWGNHIIIIQL